MAEASLAQGRFGILRPSGQLLRMASRKRTTRQAASRPTPARLLIFHSNAGQGRAGSTPPAAPRCARLRHATYSRAGLRHPQSQVDPSRSIPPNIPAPRRLLLCACRTPTPPACMPQGLSRHEARHSRCSSAIGLMQTKEFSHDRDERRHHRYGHRQPPRQQPAHQPRLHDPPHRDLAPRRRLRKLRRLGSAGNHRGRPAVLKFGDKAGPATARLHLITTRRDGLTRAHTDPGVASHNRGVRPCPTRRPRATMAASAPRVVQFRFRIAAQVTAAAPHPQHNLAASSKGRLHFVIARPTRCQASRCGLNRKPALNDRLPLWTPGVACEPNSCACGHHKQCRGTQFEPTIIKSEALRKRAAMPPDLSMLPALLLRTGAQTGHVSTASPQSGLSIGHE